MYVRCVKSNLSAVRDHGSFSWLGQKVKDCLSLTSNHRVLDAVTLAPLALALALAASTNRSAI